MTTEELITYYQNLLILQYIEQPNAYATIGVLAALPIMNQLPLAVQNAFNINPALGTTAVGVQLDVIGKYAGVTRYGYDINGNPLTLSDSDFLTLIQIATIRNFAGSSLADIQAILHEYFANEIFVYDYANMQMSYLVSSSLGDQALVEMMVQQNLLPKPMGVELATVTYITQPSLFGCLDYATGLPSPWGDFTNYSDGSEVFFNGIVYISLVDNNINNLPPAVGSSTTLSSGFYAGATSCNVASTSGFPSSGSVYVGYIGSPNFEIFSYTSKSGNQISGNTGFRYNHSSNEPVVVIYPTTATSYWEPLIYPFNDYSTYPTYESYTMLTYSAGINIV